MLEYEWGANPVSMIQLPGEDPPQPQQHDASAVDPNRHYFHPAPSFGANDGIAFDSSHHHPYSIMYQSPHHLHQLYNSRPYNGGSYSQPAGSPSNGYFLVPKVEDQANDQFASRIGLNLGGRTYFSSTEDEFVNRLYRRSRSFMDHSSPSALVNVPRCQAEGCNVDLTHAKHYHRRHKVCEFHSKASTVIAHGLTQRFCQQCSRFHLLAEFDNGKRSCRRRLADHNRRRRKSNATSKSPVPEALRYFSSETLHSSGTHSPSSVTVALSPPRLVQSSASGSGAGNSSSFFFAS